MSKNSQSVEGPDTLVHQCRLPLSTATLDMVAALIRGYLKKIDSRSRKLPPGKIAPVVLAVLRHDQRLADIAGAYEVTASTVRRWLLEAIRLLVARVHDRHRRPRLLL
ncbi:hypothetical protein [Streptomyces sp. NBC_01483]|uniref:hypothetical protein n=1 Tax=Streptomyces sp. NBC_01483 TaxID=2903883 RepID=UPI002E3517D1|nr:hypothetical protein [Streptomyces sp. NBC_01483]